MRLGLFLATMLAASSLAAAETPLTIDQLLAQGWEIAGYASGYDNRTSLILFRHPGVNALVQSGILYDVTRVPRTIVNCYELRYSRGYRGGSPTAQVSACHSVAVTPRTHGETVAARGVGDRWRAAGSCARTAAARTGERISGPRRSITQVQK